MTAILLLLSKNYDSFHLMFKNEFYNKIYKKVNFTQWIKLLLKCEIN